MSRKKRLIFFCLIIIASSITTMGVDNNNSDAESLFKTGNVFMLNGEYSLAEKSYLVAIKQYNHVSSMHNLGILYKYMNKYDEAEKYFSMAMDQQDVEYLKKLAAVFWQRKQYDKSDKYFLMAVEAEYAQNMEKLKNNKSII